MFSLPQRFYPDRAARGHRHHRDFGAILFPGFRTGPAKKRALFPACPTSSSWALLSRCTCRTMMRRYCRATPPVPAQDRLHSRCVYSLDRQHSALCQEQADFRLPIVLTVQVWRHLDTRSAVSSGYNQTISGWYYPTADGCGDLILPTLPQIQYPSKNVMFADSVPGPLASGFRGYLFGNTALNVPYTAASAGSLGARHTEGTNLTFFDGHAKWAKGTAVLWHPDAVVNCQDTSLWLNPNMDINDAHLKFNISDTCIPDP